MRKILPALAVVVVTMLVAAAVLVVSASAGGRRSTRPAPLPGGVTVRVPPGWHILRGWLSDVVDPAPRLAVASFPARLSRHTCACGFPNVVRFPPDGAFVFVWQYLHFSDRGLRRTPPRPARFALAPGGTVRQTCDGPSYTFAFKEAGRVFQVAVYLGPAATPTVRARITAMLDSLRVGAG